ncbi:MULTISPECIES: radical SAM family heme chaperone HemW [Ureibacillus]|uniref:Heme chaperone HemW n=1 Tax=Ureibacillus thermosphaericus TaxID=51173 RepID=A0A840PVW0_URETH|nr:radical SAM family heme chaperone HemW [Ureibacillus thermosphaericus]MBB5150020.1 oxygen-independent coproporphyrinogen-3 oxidase [Ureibacillus thermosphaericus]NKZ31813.1 oxygen-independent coproporphyrinogen III oxidase [Ureibacillus thermosphaericus]
MVRGVYIHIPFCHQICNYCDFNKVFFHNQPVDEYIEAVGKEIAMAVNNMPEQFENIETIYLGGGTPTALSPNQISRLLELIAKHLNIDVIEFTAEANPDELTIEKLKALKNGGVNRLSLGVQSFDQQLLQKLGRTHTNDDVYKAIDNAIAVGFQNINIDLMYGLPGQSIELWEDTLEKALALNLPHYSAYSLIVEPKTIFYIQFSKGMLHLPPEEQEAKMYDLLMERMEDSGLSQYEISNFAKEGFQSLHNKIYWDNDEYAGFGAGAHGYMNGIRYSNYGPIKKYLQSIHMGQLPILHRHQVSINEKCEEEMFLGLRKNEGVSYQQFEKKIGFSLNEKYGEIISKLMDDGLVMEEEGRVKLTRKGRFLGNEVFQQFLLYE